MATLLYGPDGKPPVVDGSPLAVLKQERAGFDELGTTGLKRYGYRGLVYEEFLLDLQGERANRVYREMADNDPIIGAFLYVIESLVRNVEWRIEGGDDQGVEFLETCLQDMSHTFEDLLSEILSMLIYGYSWHEIVYKRRMGPSRDPTKNSVYNDGKIGWRKIPIRAQDTLNEWLFGEDGGIEGFVQQAPPDYHVVPIPIGLSLLFRTKGHKGNPEGRSIIRSAYRPWYFKRRIEEIEAIGISRDLAGLPVVYRDAALAAKYDKDLKEIVRQVHRDEQEGMLLPLVYDERGNKMLTFELLSSGGARQHNTSEVIDRYNRTIATTVLADFLLLGQKQVGSFALASSKTEMFSAALGALLKSIAAVLNRYAVPRLWAANGWRQEDMPYMVPGDVEKPDLAELGEAVSKLAGAGMPLFPDDELENHLRAMYDLPRKPEGEMPKVEAFPGEEESE